MSLNHQAWNTMPGFLGLHYLNNKRNEFFYIVNDLESCTSNKQGKPVTLERAFYWIGHKTLSVVCLPANILSVGLGLCGMGSVAVAITAIKVLYYAVTGNKASFSAGRRFIDVTKHSVGHLAWNVLELGYEGKKAICFIFSRIFKGFDKTLKLEKVYPEPKRENGFLTQIPSPIYSINEFIKPSRIDFEKEDRALRNMGKHLVVSIPNIVANGVGFTVSSISLVAFTALFAAKVAVYATTNIDIPVPTYIEVSFSVAYATGNNIRIDFRDDVYDAAEAVRQAACALKINNLFQKAKELFAYIPHAYYE